jgi:hypothetical protein
MHLELSRVQSMYARSHPAFSEPNRWRVDLAVVSRDELCAAGPPLTEDSFRFDAFYEFALASSYWLHGQAFGEPRRTKAKVAADVAKVQRYVDLGLCYHGYVVVFEECDFEFEDQAVRHEDVTVRVLHGWD